MKKEKKEMIRNLLYSFCIHLLFLLIIVFADDINKLFNEKIVNINSLNINSDFLSKNKIKTTEEDLYPDLSLNEKIELYNIAKSSNYDPNLNYNSDDVNIDNFNIKDIIKNIESKSDYVLYLGPTDYKRYMNRLNEEEKARLAKIEIEEKAKLDEIIGNLTEESDIKTGSTKNIVANNTITNKINKINNKTSNKINNKTKKDTKKVNINPDKIFTKSDVEQIKEIIEKEKEAQSMLSRRERLNIQNQLISCYRNALVQTSIPSKVPVSVTIKLFSNGIIDTREIHFKVIDNENRFSTTDYNNAINNAKIALAYCNPLRNMPQNKYSSWQNINFIFDVIK